MEHTKISTDIEQNIKQFQQLFADSADTVSYTHLTLPTN